MRDLLVVIDSRYKRGEWKLWETKFAHVEAADDATAVRDLCVQMATAGHLAWDGELRVRSYPGIGWPEALMADLETVEPSAEYIYDAITETR
jgi:hypothetical protein